MGLIIKGTTIFHMRETPWIFTSSRCPFVTNIHPATSRNGLRGCQIVPLVVPKSPLDWYIYLHEWLIFMGLHVGKYTSPVEHMGYIDSRMVLGGKNKRHQASFQNLHS